MAQRILVVEDDVDLGAQLVRDLRRAGFEPTLVRDGEEALRTSVVGVDLVLLDLMLGSAYGLDVLKRIRKESAVPVLILTARDHTADKVRALGLGADDYVTKPFWPEELLARIRARLRRPELKVAGEGGAAVRAGEIEILPAERRVRAFGVDVELTRAEVGVLLALARRAGRPVERRVIAEEALEEEHDGEARALDVHVSRLRKKLGAEGKRIATVWGIGYRLDVDPAPEVKT